MKVPNKRLQGYRLLDVVKRGMKHFEVNFRAVYARRSVLLVMDDEHYETYDG